MDPNAESSRGRNVPADAYWRRRFFTLVAGLGVVGLLVWACTGIIGGKPASRASGTGQPGKIPAAYGSAAGSPSAPSVSSSGSASARAVAPAASPARSARSTVKPSASGTPARSAPAASRTGKGSAGRATAAGGACPAADLVLTLLPSKASYGPHDRPAFQIDIVSTDAAPCAVNTGPESLRVVVTHGGQPAWDSGACLHDAASRVTQLRRGVPIVVPVGWNRHLTTSGCSATMLAATQRTYVAVAQSGAVQSPGRSFRLR